MKAKRKINRRFFCRITYPLEYGWLGVEAGLRKGGVHKLRLQEEGGRWSKKLSFCKLLYHRKCKRRGVGGQKKPNLVNVVCERPLSRISREIFIILELLTK